jgi:uncharacterized damage-inducible protein DinB
MPLGYLSGLVAIMPSWIAMIVERDDLDLAAGAKPPDAASNRDLVQTFDRSVESAQRALSGTTEDHLLTVWRLRAGERILDARPRHLQIADTFSHLAHHRGQLTVYLRLNDRPVPSIYGPTADERA